LKILILFLTLNFSINAYAMSPRSRVSTPNKTRQSDNSEYSGIVTQLDALSRARSVSCNMSYRSSAHALVCNCANEAGNQSLEGMTAVSRVVFSRAKSPHYPLDVRKVVCQRHQFSWTIGGWDENCKRTKGNPTYFNSREVSGVMLAKCVSSSKKAARLELIEKPTKLYALNYCSTNPRAYRNSIPSWCRSLINTSQVRVGGHVFGFAEGGQRRPVPARGSTPGSISLFNFFKKLSFSINSAYAVENDDLKIINTRADKKTYYGDRINKILKTKYKKFSPYTFEDYSKSVKNLMGETRNNLPGSAIGDYNGDGKRDLVLMGSIEDKNVILAFLSKGRGFQDYLVSSEPAFKNPLDVYLVNIQKSKTLFNDKKARDAFQVEAFGGAAIAKLFDGKKFVDNNKKTGFKFK